MYQQGAKWRCKLVKFSPRLFQDQMQGNRSQHATDLLLSGLCFSLKVLSCLQGDQIRLQAQPLVHPCNNSVTESGVTKLSLPLLLPWHKRKTNPKPLLQCILGSHNVCSDYSSCFSRRESPSYMSDPKLGRICSLQDQSRKKTSPLESRVGA